MILLLSFAINRMLSRFAGFRQEDAPSRSATDALEAIAIGIVASTVTQPVSPATGPCQSREMAAMATGN